MVEEVDGKGGRVATHLADDADTRQGGKMSHACMVAVIVLYYQYVVTLKMETGSIPDDSD